MEHQLDEALAVAQVQERDAAVVALAPDPAAEGDLGSDVLRTQLAARVRSHGGSHVGHRHSVQGSSRVSQFTTSAAGTSFWMPSTRRRSVTIEAAASRSPTMAT